ncbi:MAG TPA: cysteine-rich CWC family protein [Sunxiuqinia sp.]|nr:cysteine-rich CWC family protein [Sunxiuqinia sp.]
MYNKHEPSECAKCGRLITCTGNIDCPCAVIEIPELVQDFIAATYDGCLCNRCIEETKSSL